MFYIVGLGNPGENYAHTRHNIGWLALSAWCQNHHLPSAVENRQYSGNYIEGTVGSQSVAVLYPNTFMNHSGSAVVKLVPREDFNNLIVVHDDIDLPFGEIKLGKSRGAGGHNGLKSIIEKMGTKDFIRVRIGIAPTGLFTGKVKRPAGGGPLERFVLKPFTAREKIKLETINQQVSEALDMILREGIEVAMNKIN